ncbi:hypothetical protein S83_067434, partial [Arachis hypogaea]
NSNSEPYNIPEAEDYDPNERENVMYDIAVYSSSFGSGEIPVFSDDMWHTLEIMDESSLDGYAISDDMALLMLSWFTDIRNGEWGDHVTLQAAADW